MPCGDCNEYNLPSESLYKLLGKVKDLMRVRQISVKKLFGIFDHTIPLNMEDRITIIHGPNGFGKTILLKMLYGFFTSRYAVWRVTPFEEFKIDFDDGTWVIARHAIDSNVPRMDVVWTDPKGQRKECRVLLLQTSEESASDDKYPDIDVTQGDSKKPTFPTKIQRERASEPEWLKHLRESVKVHFVETNRLQKLRTPRTQPGLPGLFGVPANQIKWGWTVAEYPEELAEIIQIALAEYGEVSQSLDRTFPMRVMKETSQPGFTGSELRHRLSELEEKRMRLIAAGLLDKDNNMDGQIQQEISDDSTVRLLSIYVRDTEQKLGVFDDLASRIDLFQKIVNQRFLNKRLSISKEKGLTFTTSDDKPLSVAQLSSGEQQELVLLYEILFKAEPDSLILIDEPELQQHVAWQVQFLRDLQDIIKLVPLDFLIATHSPDIINDRWDWTVELKGPAQ